MARERQLTSGAGGRILTNVAVWSSDSEWIVFDTRSDPAGDDFDGTRIESVHRHTGEIQVLYESKNGAHCGIATCHPIEARVVFVVGPEHPTADWPYGPSRRQGVMVEARLPGIIERIDARDLVPPFTAGALRGGSHVHVWSHDGALLSFTYEDEVLESQPLSTACPRDLNQRNVAVTILGRPVHVPATHPRNHDGSGYSVLVTRTANAPEPGSDEICRAFEEAWIGSNGYIRPDGTRQHRALAFQGRVVSESGNNHDEVFLVDLPNDLTRPGDGPLEGTLTRRPAPPSGVRQRRLTRTDDRRSPGVMGPRHWLRSSPDGSRIGFLMEDVRGVVQFWTVSPNGDRLERVTDSPHPIASAFTWFPDGHAIACVVDHSICRIELAGGRIVRLTARSNSESTPRPEACVVAPDGLAVAFVRRVSGNGAEANQICIVELE